MNVLIFNVNSHEGSTGMIAYSLLSYLRDSGNQAKLLCGNYREKKIDDPDVVNIDSVLQLYYSVLMTRLFGYEGCFNVLATKKAIRIIEEFKPDVVQFYNMHGYYINHYTLMEYLKMRKIPVVYSMMDEFPYMGKCAYSFDCMKFQTECKDCPRVRDYPTSWFFDNSNKIFRRKKTIYDGFKNLVFTGPQWVLNRALTSPLIKEQRLELLNEPINYDKTFYPRDVFQLRNKLKIPKGNKVVLSVTVMSNPRKGGKYFLEVAELLKNNKNISFVFVGYNINKKAPDNVITIPYVKSEDMLATYMSMGDILVCTSIADTMPNVCLDALGCGTPLCGFAEKGTPFCAPEPLGLFTETFNVDALKNVIENAPLKTKEISDACVKYAHENFHTNNVFEKLYNIYQEIIK